MKDSQHHDPIDVLGEAYEKMYERAIENIHTAEEKTGPLLHKLIEEAKDKAIDLKEISEEDAEKIADYLKRDLSDAAHYLSESGRELKDWLGFETALLEADTLYLLQEIADPTTLELQKLKLDAQRASVYRSGEITGPGTLVCDQCGEKLHFHKPGKIPPCPKCHASSFHRQHGE